MDSISRFLVAPPIGGALYDRLGFRAPFVFGMIVVALDFVGRILFIERKHALQWQTEASDAPQPDSAPEEPSSEAPIGIFVVS